LILSRIHRLPEKPNQLLLGSADGDRPASASLFSRTALLSSLSDLSNSMFKPPFGQACFSQVVDQVSGSYEPSRLALELSLAKVKPFDIHAFEELLEVQEKVYRISENQALLQDNLGNFLLPRSNTKKASRDHQIRNLTCIEAFLETDAIDRGSCDFILKGRDFPVTDFREGLNGIADFFQRWNYWLRDEGLTPTSIDQIFIYSHIRNILPSCWNQLFQLGVSADQVRLPQWSGLSNALSSFMEFLLTDGKRATFFYFPMNGRCHMAYLVRNR
jgi:hypothetical protein